MSGLFFRVQDRADGRVRLLPNRLVWREPKNACGSVLEFSCTFDLRRIDPIRFEGIELRRQTHRKGAAAVRIVLDGNCSSMRIDDRVANTQTETSSLGRLVSLTRFVAAKKAFEQVGFVPFLDTASVIADSKDRLMVLGIQV